jgi:hypothetical protein
VRGHLRSRPASGRERARGLEVQTGSDRRGKIAVDRLPYEVVPEAKVVAIASQYARLESLAQRPQKVRNGPLEQQR